MNTNSNSHQNLPMCEMIYLKNEWKGKIFIGNEVTMQKSTPNKRELKLLSTYTFLLLHILLSELDLDKLSVANGLYKQL